jgi:2-polyprenyl-3-methyl-5-hydroxy-6-metoxy-1,4-benzoquinol methylase
MTEHDRRYLAWAGRQGPRVHDLDWRLRHLPWRHRFLLHRYAVQGRRVLDYGCGDGVLAVALARRGATVVGFDVSRAAIAQAARFGAGTTGLALTTSEPDGAAFDLVFCTEVLEHVENDAAFAARLAALARPGGLVIGTTPVGRAFWDPDHRHIYDVARLRALFEPLGRLRLRRRYRSTLRNLLPWRQRGAAVFHFELVRSG